MRGSFVTEKIILLLLKLACFLEFKILLNLFISNSSSLSLSLLSSSSLVLKFRFLKAFLGEKLGVL